MTSSSSRLLPIGEFSAATQLSPKALRLYDEQRLLRPAVVDASSGYRYYREDQIAPGRLIRTLRDMELSLADVANVMVAEGPQAETLLRRFAEEGERRLARQKRAFEAALSMLRQGKPSEMLVITERVRPSSTVTVQPFLADRRSLIERYRRELAAGFAALAQHGITPAGEPSCALIDPVSDDESRAEVLIPVPVQAATAGLTLRQLPARDCAVLGLEPRELDAFDATAALDALFDWFDRRGCHAAEAPTVMLVATEAGTRTELVWAFEAVSTSTSSR